MNDVRTARARLERWGSTPVGVVIGLFVLVRLATLTVAWLTTTVTPGLGITEMLTEWDGNWNEIVANDWYTRVPLSAQYRHEWLTLAFFPVLPAITGMLHVLTGVGVHILGPLVSMAFGAVAVALLARLLDRRFGRQVAVAACALLLVAPQAFVLSMFYTEGPMLLWAVLTLDALDRGRWARAGVWAFLGGLTRPNGFLLVVPCLVAAARHFRASEGRSRWAGWIAPTFAPLGFLGWLAVAWVATGEPSGYFAIQSEGWGARVDGGGQTLRTVVDFVSGSPLSLDARLNVLSIAVLGVGGLVLAVRQRMDVVMLSWAAALVALTAFSERQASGGRFLLPAFPLFVAWATAIPRWLRTPVVVASSMVMTALFVISTRDLGLTP